ncbi:MAG TPA: LysR substrate-binding domain-containing protein [Pseudolabrys sp.]|jgi:DNA-binding transcriptional LysR family regulator|nr:LysR substrate-binding domain-containing protein [Pseudolabrys sp.]
MTNIPTDLLRTLVAVVDLRSFTKAAVSLGITQPAVSAQIKRLQFLLGADLFDRSAQGVSLTAQGEVVVSYARRLLSINDQIVDLGGAELRPDVVIRVGTPSDFVASALPGTLARFRARWPDVRFIVRTDYFDQLVRGLRGAEIDVLVALSMSEPVDARHWRRQEVVWVRSENTHINPKEPVPLVSHGEPSVYHRVAVQALRSAGLDWQDVFTGPSMTSLSGAVAAGLGVMAVTRRRAEAIGLPVWEDAPLPKLRDVFSGVYVRESGARSTYEQLADEIAKNLFPAGDRVTGSAARLGGQRQATSAA